MLYDMDGTIGIMKTIRVGDRIQLDNRLYAGFTGEVVKVDKRKGRAKITFEFDGNTQNVWVGYDEITQASVPRGGSATGGDARAGTTEPGEIRDREQTAE